MAEPPSFDGAVNETVACVFPAVAYTDVGAFDIVTGVTEVEAALAALVSTALVALTVKV
jgi:hypothetical protein